MADLQHQQPTPHIGTEIGVRDPVTRGAYHNHLHTHDNQATGPQSERFTGGQYQHTHPHWDGHEHSTVNPRLQVTVAQIEMLFLFSTKYQIIHHDPNNFFGSDRAARISTHGHGTSTEHLHIAVDEEWINFNDIDHGHVYRA